jgi:hypothetical protein
LTYLAWEALPDAFAAASTALQVIGERGRNPPLHDKAIVHEEIMNTIVYKSRRNVKFFVFLPYVRMTAL